MTLVPVPAVGMPLSITRAGTGAWISVAQLSQTHLPDAQHVQLGCASSGSGAPYKELPYQAGQVSLPRRHLRPSLPGSSFLSYE
ncbi:hypothetical protein D3C77_582020 [compost metagenome]